jgi:hypothetical protein
MASVSCRFRWPSIRYRLYRVETEARHDAPSRPDAECTSSAQRPKKPPSKSTPGAGADDAAIEGQATMKKPYVVEYKTLTDEDLAQLKAQIESFDTIDDVDEDVLYILESEWPEAGRREG